MTITKNQNGTSVTLSVEGRLDTITAPDLEKEIQSLSEAASLEIDFANLEYISSAGLRVLLAAQKVMNRQGKMIITGTSETVMEIFEVTGFVDILNIE